MNTSTHRLVVLIVGLALILSLVGIAVLAVLGTDTPKVLELAASSALTGLLGLVASPKQDGTVRIDQPPGDPIPVRDAGHSTFEVIAISALVSVVVLVVFLLIR